MNSRGTVKCTVEPCMAKGIQNMMPRKTCGSKNGRDDS